YSFCFYATVSILFFSLSYTTLFRSLDGGIQERLVDQGLTVTGRHLRPGVVFDPTDVVDVARRGGSATGQAEGACGSFDDRTRGVCHVSCFLMVLCGVDRTGGPEVCGPSVRVYAED